MNTTQITSMPRSRRRWLGLGLVGAAVAVAAGVGVTGIVHATTPAKRPPIPRDSEVEGHSGVRIIRASLAGDGGLIDVRYVILDPSLATKWTGNTDAPPVLDNERTHHQMDRVAAMRDGHDLRPGQTYYLIYLNKGADIKRGDKIDITIANTVLHGVTVE